MENFVSCIVDGLESGEGVDSLIQHTTSTSSTGFYDFIFDSKSTSSYSSAKKGRRGKSIAGSGSVRRSARFRSSQSQSLGKLHDSSALSDATNSVLGTIFVLGSIYSSYALSSLSSSKFCHLARDTTFVFSEVELDSDY